MYKLSVLCSCLCIVCIAVLLSIDSIYFKMGLKSVNGELKLAMGGRCPPLPPIQMNPMAFQDLILKNLRNEKPDNTTVKHKLNGLRFRINFYPFDIVDYQDDVEYYEESGDIEIKLAFINGKLITTNFDMSRYIPYNISQGEATSDAYTNILLDKNVNKPVGFKYLIEFLFIFLNFNTTTKPDTQTPQTFTRIIDFPVLKVLNLSFGIEDMPDMKLSYGGLTQTKEGGIVLEEYWASNILEKNIVCELLNDDVMQLLTQLTLPKHHIHLGPPTRKPHPFVETTLRELPIPEGRMLTLLVHPVFAIPMHARFDVQANIIMIRNYNVETPRRQQIPMFRISVVLESLPDVHKRVLQSTIYNHTIIKLVTIVVFFILLFPTVYPCIAYRRREKHLLPVTNSESSTQHSTTGDGLLPDPTHLSTH